MVITPECTILRGETPDEQAALVSLLGHKGKPWLQHVKEYFKKGKDGALEGLDWRFYCAKEGGELLSNICTWERAGEGLLAHVYTLPKARGRGLAGALMGLCLQDFEARGGSWLQLNVEPNSFQQAFYLKSGFRPVPDVSGCMVYRVESQESAETNLQSNRAPQAQGGCRITPFRWGQFIRWNRFFLESVHKPTRHMGFDLEVPGSLEFPLINARLTRGAFLGYSLEREDGRVEAVATRIRRKNVYWIDIHRRESVADSALQQLLGLLLRGVQDAEMCWNARENLGVLAAANGFRYCEQREVWACNAGLY